MTRWTTKTDRFLRKNRGKLSLRELADALGVPQYEVKNRLEDLDAETRLARLRSRDRERSCLYGEFESYYLAHRCRWAPENPRRVFNFCLKVVYRRYRKRLTLPAFLSLVYATLGVPFDESRPHKLKDKKRLHGMFQKFDPAKYKGKLAIEDHFLNLLRRKLEGRVWRYLKTPTDSFNEGDPSVFRAWDARKHIHDLAEELPAAMQALEEEERKVVHLKYWEGLSNRKIGTVLGIDHKTAKATHDKAVRKLERYYNNEDYAQPA